MIKKGSRTSPKMSVDAHVSSRSAQTLSLSVRDVFYQHERYPDKHLAVWSTQKRCRWSIRRTLRLGIPVLFCHTKVDDVDGVGALSGWSTNEEVVGLNVPVDEVLLVNGLDASKL